MTSGDIERIERAFGFYFYPPVWVVEPPLTDGKIDFTRFGDIVYTRTLPSGIAVKVSRDGIFLFDFLGWSGPYPDMTGLNTFDIRAETILRRLQVLNTYLACLYTAVLRQQRFAFPVMALSPADTVRSSTFDDPGLVGASGWGFGTMAVSHFRVRFSRFTDPAEFERVDPRLKFRTALIERNTLDHSYELLTSILAHSSRHALQLGDLYVRACNSYVAHDYARCLVSAWAISEKLIHGRWDRYIEANRQRETDGRSITFISSDRKGVLKSANSFTASVIVEILSLLDIIPVVLYQSLTRVRRTRNKWLHDLDPISRAEAEEAVQLSERMMNLVEAIDLSVPLSAHL